MTKALSNDLRERVVATVLAGEPTRSVACRFGVAVSSVVHLVVEEIGFTSHPTFGKITPKGIAVRTALQECPHEARKEPADAAN